MSTPPPVASAAGAAGAPCRAAVRATRTGTVPMIAIAGGQAVRYTSRIPATSGGIRLQVSPAPPSLGAPPTTLTTAPPTAPSAAGTTQAAAISMAAVDG